MSVTHDVAEHDVGDASLRQARQCRDVFVGVGVPAAPGGELLQLEPGRVCRQDAGRQAVRTASPAVFIEHRNHGHNVEAVPCAQHGQATVFATAHEIAAFGVVMPDRPWPPLHIDDTPTGEVNDERR